MWAKPQNIGAPTQPVCLQYRKMDLILKLFFLVKSALYQIGLALDIELKM